MVFSIADAYGLWIPSSPEGLIEKSQTIFVGTVVDVSPKDMEYQTQIAKDGTIKDKVGPEIITLDEYTVDVEEFLKNPQDSNTIKVLRATVGGVPGGPAKISGFEVGDRVLFYLPKEEKQTHFPGQYLPESFKIPMNCDAKTVLKQPKIELRNSFEVFQDGIAKKDNFTAGVPMEFVLSKDMDTLDGASIDVDVSIRKEGSSESLFERKIHSESLPCQWISSVVWEFTPEEGHYRMYLHVQEGERGADTSYTGFSVVSEKKSMKLSPLKQFKFGIPIDEIACNDQLILIQKYDGSPACVKPKSIEKLIDRNWTTSLIVREIALRTMSKNLGPECSQHTIQEIQNGIIDENCRNYLTNLSEEHKSEMTSKGYSFDREQNVWVKEGYPDTMMSIVDFYLSNQNRSTSATNESKTPEKSWTASYHPEFLPLKSIDSFGKIRSIDIDQNNNVVVGTQTGNHNGVLHYLDKRGNEIWQKKTDKILGFVDISEGGGQITTYGYELTDGGARAHYNHQLIVFDKLGTELWRYPPNFDFEDENKDYSSFTLSSTNEGDFHLIGKGNKTSLLDSNGNKVWESFISGDSRTSKISQTENFILIGTENDQDKIDYDWGLSLLGIDGQILWEKSGIDGQIISSNAIAISSNDNFISLGIAPRGDEGILYVFDRSGELIWKEITTSVISFTDFTKDENNLVVITNEEMRFYDIDGNLLWTKDIVFRPAISSYYVAGRSPYEYQDLLRVFDYGGNQVYEYLVNSTISSIKISDDSKLLVMGTQGKTEIGPGKIFYFNQMER